MKRDGMPDSWEKSNCLNANNYNDRNGDQDGDGYTNLEECLNGIITNWDFSQSN